MTRTVYPTMGDVLPAAGSRRDLPDDTWSRVVVFASPVIHNGVALEPYLRVYPDRIGYLIHFP
jgi:hypothetical protein